MAPHIPRSILVIDDEPSFVRVLMRLLQRDGYVVEYMRSPLTYPYGNLCTAK
jgi:CheY-like chemotaxis protein